MIEGIDDLAADLMRSAATADAVVAPVVKKGAVEIRKAMRSEALGGGGSTHARLASDITFDMTDPLTAEIGPTLGDSGSMQLLYLGNSRHAPSIPDPIIAGEREAAMIEQYIAKAVTDALR